MDEMGQPMLPEPEISYVSKVALALRAMHNLSLARTMERNAVIAQVRPEVLDNFKWDVITRETARNDGLPSDWLADEVDVENERVSRAQMQAQMQQEQSMLNMAEAAGKAGSVKQDQCFGRSDEPSDRRMTTDKELDRSRELQRVSTLPTTASFGTEEGKTGAAKPCARISAWVGPPLSAP
jgi:hypothetical protein